MTVSAIKYNVGTTLTWKDSGGDYVISVNGLAAVTGRVGAVGDFGAWPRPAFLRWSLVTSWQANPVANETLDFHVAGWDNDTGPAVDWGTVGTSDAAFLSTQRQNTKFIGPVVAELAGTGTFKSGGRFEWPFRYISPALYNASAAKALTASANVTILRLTPFYPEAQ